MDGVYTCRFASFLADRSLAFHNPWLDFQLDLVRCAWAIFPATCLWGASFPLAIAAVSSPGKDPGRLVGNIYAANTVGAILGAVGFSIILIAWIGTQQSQRVLMGLSLTAGLWMFVPLLWPVAEPGQRLGR